MTAGSRDVAMVSGEEVLALVLGTFGAESAEVAEARALLDRMRATATGEDVEAFFIAEARLADIERRALAKRGNGHGQVEDGASPPATAGPHYFLEDGRAFMARVEKLPPPRMLVPGLIGEDVIHAMHGQPRGLKTLVYMDVVLSASAGLPPLGLERLRPSAPVRIGYATEEDGERHFYKRMRELVAGKGLTEIPDTLYLAVRSGLSIDNGRDQEALIEAARRLRLQHFVFDPWRAFTGHADQGPAELKPAADFLRRFMRETACSIGIVSHDTKPQAGKPEDRPRPQRMSGGGLFSIVDAPVHVERIDAKRSLFAPTGYKHMEDPPAFVVTLSHGDGWLRLEGQDADATKAGELVMSERVIEFLRNNPGSSGSSVSRGLKAGKQVVLEVLRSLSDAGRLDSIDRGRAVQWFVKGEA